MAKVLSVAHDTAKKKLRIRIADSENVTVYTVSEATYISIGSPLVGEEIHDRELDAVRFEDERNRAMNKAYSYLSLSDKSRFELKMKLVRAGFSREVCDLTVDRLSELGYLDEERQLERAVEREANYKLRGRYYIRKRLAQKGYSPSGINRAISVLTQRGEVDFGANFERLAEKKGATTEEERTALEYKFGYKI